MTWKKYQVPDGKYIDECGQEIEICGTTATQEGVAYRILFQTPQGEFGPKIHMIPKNLASCLKEEKGGMRHRSLVQKLWLDHLNKFFD